MLEEKHHKNPAQQTLDQLPSDIFQHMTPMLNLKEHATLYCANRKTNEMSQLPYHLREVMGLNSQEHQDLKLPPEDMVGIYQLLQKIYDDRDSSDSLRAITAGIEDNDKKFSRLFNLLKQQQINNKIILDVCKNHPEVAQFCISVSFIREKLSREDHQINNRQPNTVSRITGGVLGLLSGLVFQFLNLIFIESSIFLRGLFSILHRWALPALAILATGTVIPVFCILRHTPVTFFVVCASIVGFAAASLGSLLLSKSGDFLKAYKEMTFLPILLIRGLITFPVKIYYITIRGFEAGHEQVLNNFWNFICVNEHSSFTHNSIFLEGKIAWPLKQPMSASSYIFPKPWSRIQVLLKIFNPNIAQLAEAYNSETSKNTVSADKSRNNFEGLNAKGVVRILPETKRETAGPSTSKPDQKQNRTNSFWRRTNQGNATTTHSQPSINGNLSSAIPSQEDHQLS